MEIKQRNGDLWLAAACVCILLALIARGYDLLQTTENLEARLGKKISARIHQWENRAFANRKPEMPEVQLAYLADGKLAGWEGEAWMPPLKPEGLRLEKIPRQPVIRLAGRTYYQLRKQEGDTLRIALLPLQIEWNTRNRFFPPYFFPGDFPEYLARTMTIETNVEPDASGVVLKNAKGKPLARYKGELNAWLRQPLRQVSYLFWLFGGMAFLGYAWVVVRRRPQWRGRLFLGLAALAVLVRLTIGLMDWEPLSALAGPSLLDASRLAVDPFVAPNLGVLLVNTATLAVLVLLGYAYAYLRIGAYLQRKINRSPVALALSLIAWMVAAGLLRWLFHLMELGYTNSNLDFNLAAFSPEAQFTYLALAAAGLLLLCWILVSSVLLLAPALALFQKPATRWEASIQGVFALGATGIWFASDGKLVLSAVVLLGALLFSLAKSKGQPIYRQSFASLLALLMASALAITGVLARAHQQSQEIKAGVVATTIIGKEGYNLASQFLRARFAMMKEATDIRNAFDSSTLRAGDFQSWLWDTYFRDRFPQATGAVYLFDNERNALAPYKNRPPVFSPEYGIGIEAISLQVDTSGFYRLLNFDNNYQDMYIGVLKLDTLTRPGITAYIEFVPRPTRGVYPLLSLADEQIDDLNLLSSVDYGIYLDKRLYRSQGTSIFPYILAVGDAVQASRKTGPREWEYVHDVGLNRKVVVRYRDLSLLDQFTTFSLVFYFLSLLSLVFLALPILLAHRAVGRRFGLQLPIRARLRFWMLLISVLPLFGVLLLAPSIRLQYQSQNRQLLSNETARVVGLLTPEYQLLQAPGSSFSSRNITENLQSQVRRIAESGEFDIHVYAHDGALDFSSQPDLFNSELWPSFMSADALRAFRRDSLSQYIASESVGKLTYLSGYGVILGKQNEPYRYINVSLLAQREEIEKQISNLISFLANAYLILFLVINFAAILAADAISKPLAVLKARLSNVRLGARPEPIAYENEDEIGELVKAYNGMAAQLAESEKQLAQTQRELAWKQMARQVAHEIKNPLTPMRLSIQMLLRAWQEKRQDRLEAQFEKSMDSLLRQIDTLVRISNSFSEFARMPEPEKTRVDLAAELTQVASLYAAADQIEWEMEGPQGPVWVWADKDQLGRAIQNLTLNALQAMDGKGKIRMVVTVTGPFIRLMVEDNGPGMAEEVERRAFEPNFTTRQTGMGLGLAMVKRMVETNGGKIWFENRQGQGVTFFIELPAAGDAYGG